MMMFKALLFDKGGTLLEFHHSWPIITHSACQQVKADSNKNQVHQYVTEDELLLVIGVEGAIVHNHGRLASNPVEDTAIAWFELLCPAISLQEFTRVAKTMCHDQVENNPY